MISEHVGTCFTQRRLPLHNLNAGTSSLLNEQDMQDFEYERQLITPSTSAFPTFSNFSESSLGHTDSCDNTFGDTSIAPGPTSCVFLEKELKRLYAKEDFDVLESLGEGFFGDVFKVKHRITGEIMVLKIGKDRERDNRIRAKANVLKEAALLNQLTYHPNILAFRGACVDIDPNEGLWNLHILVDYCDGGSLNRLICNTQKVFPWQLRCSLGRDIACAMLYVHSKDIMHRDLTSMNVLLQTAATGTKAVVADFGLSCRIPHHDEYLVQVGTPYWMAPECLKEEFYDQNADVFSFGIILCQMIARIDADPEAGMYRTDNFGLDYVRFLAHCPMDTPLELLKLAFQCVVVCFTCCYSSA
uniref:Protein kinase domain-containing protein n=1 Tax=Syphacia muris TaxID=451379 RepID=A0A0N5AI48_9BILA